MKSILKIILIFLPLLAFGQKKVAHEIIALKKVNTKFAEFNLFEDTVDSLDSTSKKILRSADFAILKKSELNKIMQNQPRTIQIQIPYKNESIIIELFQVNIFSENFKINTDKLDNIPYEKGLHYRGIIKGNENSIASFNFFKNELNGIISSIELGNLNIGKLLNQSITDNYIIYSDLDLLIQNEFKCNTKDDTVKPYNDATNNLNRSTFKCVSTYIEIGYQAFEANGSNLTTTTNWITSIFNNSQTLFSNDGISISLKSLFIWTSDDYYSISSNFILPAFKNIRPYFDGDIGFIADVDPGSLGGQAFSIGGICSDRKFAYGDLTLNFANIPTFSQPVYILTHELGHVLGSHHTHACVWNGDNTAIDGCATSYGGCQTPFTPPGTLGTIMSYCFPNFSLGFGLQPTSVILQHIDDSECLGTDCNTSCINTIGSIQVLNTTQTSTDIQWVDYNLSSNSWEISVVPAGDLPIWESTTNTTYSLTGLEPNTYYDVTIRGNCSEGYLYPSHSRIFATQGDNCGGTIIYDTGGPTAGYGGSEHIIRTIVPTIPNKKIKLTFNNVNLVPFEGWLFIYDGLDTNGPLLNNLTTDFTFLAYGFGGTFYPAGNTFESFDASGALTIEFFSSQEFIFNPIASNRGWIATVNCVNTLGLDEFGDGFIDYSYSPNPVNDILNIKAKDVINEVNIFSIDGKLISKLKSFEMYANMDLSNYDSGTYIVKLIFEQGETSFKIIKE